MISAKNTIEYLKEHGLEALKGEPNNISIREYDDVFVANYDIFTKKDSPIGHECRNLILNKSDFSVASQSFKRFFNLGEFDVKDFDFEWAEEKADGSIISMWLDKDNNVQYSTRSSAFAEVSTNTGKTFRGLCEEAQQHAGFSDDGVRKLFQDFNLLTLIFELVSIHNRVVTRYDQTELILTGGRTRENGAELTNPSLAYIAACLRVDRPKKHFFGNIDEVKYYVESLPIEQEGVVLVKENLSGVHHHRLKLKNSGYLALHALRNGPLTNSRILDLIRNDNLDEYLTQFSEDKPIIDPVQEAYKKLCYNLNYVWNEYKDLPSRKDFAIAVKKKVSLAGPLFATLDKKYELPSYALKDVSIDSILSVLEKDYGIKNG